jgi:hypothetical protein
MDRNGKTELLHADSRETGLVNRHSTETLVAQAKETIANALAASSAQVANAFQESKDVIKSCEARIAAEEEIQVIIERDRTILNVKRKFEFAKDK